MRHKQTLEQLSASETNLNSEEPAPLSKARTPSGFGFRT